MRKLSMQYHRGSQLLSSDVVFFPPAAMPHLHIKAPTTLKAIKMERAQLPLPLILNPALAYDPSLPPVALLALRAFCTLKHPNMPFPLALSFSNAAIFSARQLWTMSGESVMQY